ncbi:MAG: alkaline phosphatase D family protein [Planctomycetota bacterium]
MDQAEQMSGMTRRRFVKASAGAAVAAGVGSGLLPGSVLPGVLAQQKQDINMLHRGSIETSLHILNMWGKKPQAVNDYYTAIYNALAASPTATYEDVSKDAEVRRLAAELGVTHLGGPLLGCLEPDGATVWVRTLEPASVTVKAEIGGKETAFGPAASTYESDLSALVKVTGLPTGKRTPYRVFVDGKPIMMQENAAITTPNASLATTTRIAFGTCPHRWGLGNEQLMTAILARNPLAMILSGDIGAQGRRNNFAMHRADYALRDMHPAFQKLVAATPVYTSWDDHDYFSNDQWGIPKNMTDADRRGVREVYTKSWNNTSYGIEETGEGIFQHTTVGPVDIILTDSRYFREKTGKHCYLGKRQMAWLKDTLKSCKGRFIIMTNSTMWSDFVSNGKDSWGRYDPEGREELFSFIEAEKIGGVLLTSGDRHGARVFSIPRPSGFSFYEFEPACLGGRVGPPARSDAWETQLFGMSGKYAFGEFTFNTELDDPEVTFNLIGEAGNLMYDLTLSRSTLTPGGV